MLLALDVGNTQIYGGVFKGDKLLAKFRATSGSSTSDEFGTFFKSALRENGIDPKEITELAICSVVPDLIYALHQASLKYFGLEPFLLTATVEGIVAQRLVRRICVNCKAPYDPADEELYELELTPSDVEGRQFYYGKGCKKCNGTGYKGRVALFEMMIMNDRLRTLIMNHASTADLRTASREDGMRSLRDSGLLHIYDGVTTIEEVVKETIATI